MIRRLTDRSKDITIDDIISKINNICDYINQKEFEGEFKPDMRENDN